MTDGTELATFVGGVEVRGHGFTGFTGRGMASVGREGIEFRLSAPFGRVAHRYVKRADLGIVYPVQARRLSLASLIAAVIPSQSNTGVRFLTPPAACLPTAMPIAASPIAASCRSCSTCSTSWGIRWTGGCGLTDCTGSARRSRIAGRTHSSTPTTAPGFPRRPNDHRAGPGQPPGARASPALAGQAAHDSGVTRYSATPSGGTVALIFPADEMSNVVWPPTTVDWPPQRSWTW